METHIIMEKQNLVLEKKKQNRFCGKIKRFMTKSLTRSKLPTYRVGPPKSNLIQENDRQGRFTRTFINKVYREYVDAYLHTITTNQFCGNTIVFVFSQQKEPEVIPIQLDAFDNKSISEACLFARSLAEGTADNLELILFGNVADAKKGKKVILGCRDTFGNTLHRLYEIDTKNQRVVARRSLPFFNKWIPPVGKQLPKDIVRFQESPLNKIVLHWSLSKTDLLKQEDLHKK